jgi:hypothetical protein
MINGIKLGMTVAEPQLDLENDFEPGETDVERYTLLGVPEPIYTVEILPIKWKIEDGRQVLAACKEVRAVEEIKGCEEDCVPVDPCGTRECGTMLNNCYDEVECGLGCGIGDFCDSSGQCVTPEDCSATCDSLGYVCGTWTICGISIECGPLSDGGCPDGRQCDDDGHCVITPSTCDGVWNPGEENVECDNPADSNCDSNCYCVEGYIGDGGGGCEVQSGIPQSCQGICYYLGYTGMPVASCMQNPQQCSPGVHEDSGDPWCKIGNADTCCCYN